MVLSIQLRLVVSMTMVGYTPTPPMGPDGESVGLVPDSLEQHVRLGIGIQLQRPGAARSENFLLAFGETHHGHAEFDEFLQGSDSSGQLPFATVDHDHRRQRGKALVAIPVMR